MANEAPNPILPSHPKNPVGQVRRFQAAAKRVGKHLTETRRWLKETLMAIPRREIVANAYRGVQPRTYEYLIDSEALQAVIQEILERLQGVPSDYVARMVREAYEDGTDAAIANLINLSSDYTRTFTQAIQEQPWQRRVSLMRARVFEEMDSFVGDTATNLGRVLSNGVRDGRAASDVALDIDRIFKTGRARATRIARTEMTTAYRRARWDEAQEAQENFGLRTAMMHLSARSPTTRKDHRERHGLIYTIQQVRQWYTEGANAINCKCSQVEVLVDEKGNPLNESFAKKIRNQIK